MLTESSSVVVSRRDTSEAIMPCADHVREAARQGVPSSGISAGAMIAPTSAILGGRCLAGVPAVPEWSAEGPESVTVEPGLGLVDRPVEVHVTQFGNRGRLAALVESGAIDRGIGIGIGINTTAIVDGASTIAVDDGRVWFVERSSEGAVVVSSRTST